MSTSTPDTEAAPARRRWRPGRRTLEIVALCAALLLLLIALWDWNWFKGPAERAVSSATGRAFHIDGDLGVDLGRTITVSADGLRLANPAWSQQAEMATVVAAPVNSAPPQPGGSSASNCQAVIDPVAISLLVSAGYFWP